MVLHMNLGQDSYDIIVRRGILKTAGKYLSLKRKVLVVTDDGVPKEYAKSIAAACKEAYTVTIPSGEASKNFDTLQLLLRSMLQNGFSRSDAVVAVGGGVVGDLSGFAASVYMRGIDFYNIPTTLLSMVDSSIGGKTAIDFDNIKNCVGSFHQPKAVLIDPDVLKTLPARQVSNGLAEAIKMASTFDADLFKLIEENDREDIMNEIISKSLSIKKSVVEKDEKESGIRRVLNFGHTIGHGIESCSNGTLYHGECVSLGMLAMCSPEARCRIIKVLQKNNLPTEFGNLNAVRVCEAITHDKKREVDSLKVIYVPKIGTYEIQKVSIAEFESTVKEALAK